MNCCRLHSNHHPPNYIPAQGKNDTTAAMTNLQGASDLYAFAALCTSKAVSSSTACLLYHRTLLLRNVLLDQYIKQNSYHLAPLLEALKWRLSTTATWRFLGVEALTCFTWISTSTSSWGCSPTVFQHDWVFEHYCSIDGIQCLLSEQMDLSYYVNLKNSRLLFN